MSGYDRHDERTIRAGRRARDWVKSGLLSAEQYERIKPELQVELRRTNLFLRLVLFVFSMLILQSVFGLVAIFVDIRNQTPAAILCAVAAVFFFWLAGYLVTRYRLYRFGIEEAAAVAAILLMGVSAAVGWSGARGGSNAIIAAGMIGAAAVAVAVFVRFGYLYAAIAATALVTALPFQYGQSEIAPRLAAIVILAVVAAVTRIKHSEYGDEHPGDTCALLEAGAWVGIYCLVNLQIFTRIDRSSWFYWATYAGIWILPLVGLWLSIRGRHRMLLDVSILMLLATLMTNKLYLGSARYPWDPIVFGLLLMGAAIAIKRWLAAGEDGSRDGFTATRVLASDKAKVGAFSIASLAHPAASDPQPASAPADPIGGGGRSGGAGASGSF